MALIIMCSHCGAILRYEESKIVSPRDVVKNFGYRCPKCRSTLKVDNFEVEIKERTRKKMGSQTVIRYRSTWRRRRRRVRSRRVF